MTWQGKRVVILGAARQGTALARWLVAQGARVTLSDMNASVDVSGLADLTNRMTFALGGHPLTLLDDCDVLCLSGGVPIDLPIVLEAKQRGVPLSNDAQIFFDVCPAPIIGITGSAGKTTTTTLIGEILKEKLRIENDELRKLQRDSNSQFPIPHSPLQVWIGGNIGNPLISDVQNIQPNDFVVMELSSFQLEQMTCSPHIACITNITPNHLDRHGTMDAYIAAKRHIIDFQSDDDWQVLSADNDVTAGMNTRARTLWFSTRREPQGDGAWMDEDGNLRIRILDFGLPILDWEPLQSKIQNPKSKIDEVICHRRELLLMGEHNILNVLAASAVCAIAGAPVSAMHQVATTFRGVAHRLQLIREDAGVRWYDDSIATAPERLMAALKCFDQPVILLAGGRDKHLPWSEAAQMMLERCKAVVLFGEMGPMVSDEISRAMGETQNVPDPVSRSEKRNGDHGTERRTSCVMRQTLQEAVETAREIAASGDVVLLSPGGTSYDAFKDFAERGDRFREWVNQTR
jgi:UDP-N-acetylmuramoylalanine--D-glutamate ligase